MAHIDKERQAGAELDGVQLPSGMTVGCAHEIAHIIDEHERANFYNEPDAPSSVETAIKAFQVAVSHLR